MQQPEISIHPLIGRLRCKYIFNVLTFAIVLHQFSFAIQFLNIVSLISSSSSHGIIGLEIKDLSVSKILYKGTSNPIILTALNTMILQYVVFYQ